MMRLVDNKHCYWKKLNEKKKFKNSINIFYNHFSGRFAIRMPQLRSTSKDYLSEQVTLIPSS